MRLRRWGRVATLVAMCTGLSAAGLAAAPGAYGLVGGVAPSAPAPGTCAASPGASSCTVTAVTLATTLPACASPCLGDTLAVGASGELSIEATYSDGSQGPLTVPGGSAAPVATVSTPPLPSGALALTGVISDSQSDDQVVLSALAVTTSPAVVTVSYQGLSALSAPINARSQPSCGTAGLPACTVVPGSLLTVQDQVVSGAPGSANPGTTTPLGGAVVDISQAGTGTGAYVTGAPCYASTGPTGTTTTTTGATSTTGSTPASTTSTTAGTTSTTAGTTSTTAGTTSTTAGTTSTTAGTTSTTSNAPSTPSCQPPAGDEPATAATASCATGAVNGTCALVAMWDGPDETFRGPDTLSFFPPAGYLVTSVTGCQALSGPAWAPTCTLAPGDWGPALAVMFDLEPYPTLTVNITGPAEPQWAQYGAIGEPTTYDNDMVNGTTVTISPVSGAAGSAVTCAVEGGFPGVASGDGTEMFAGVPASCSVQLPPGNYQASVPTSYSTPDSEVGIGEAYISGANTQQVTLAAGQPGSAGFTTVYEPTITINLGGPLEPATCDPTFPGSCPAGASAMAASPEYDNDAVDGTTVTITPSASTGGPALMCQVYDGYPGATDGIGTSDADDDLAQPASCAVNVPSGTYTVSVPSLVPTPASEVGIPDAEVSGASQQTLTVGPGAEPNVNFATQYQPTLTVEVAGPLEPGCTAGTCPASDLVYDNDSIDGVTATIVPVAGTPGPTTSCQLEGGYPGDNSDYGQVAACTEALVPGTYSVTLPSSITPQLDYGWGDVDVAAPTQTVTVQAGSADFANFTTSYQSTTNLDTGAGSAQTGNGLLSATGSGGQGTVSVGAYAADPEGPASFNLNSPTYEYFETSLSADSTFTSVEVTACGLKNYADALDWWDPAAANGNGQWEPVTPATAVRSAKAGCLTVTLGANSSPTLDDLVAGANASTSGFGYGPSPGTGAGAIFAVPLDLATQQVVLAPALPSRGTVGTSLKLSSSASSGLPTSISIDSASTPGSCSLNGASLELHAAGTCSVDVTQTGNDRWALASSQFHVTVLPGKPLARPAAYSTTTDKTLRVGAARGVLAKDTLNGAAIVAHTATAHGTLALAANGSFVYVPKHGFYGTDTFNYTLSNESGRSTTVVTIKIERIAAAKDQKTS